MRSHYAVPSPVHRPDDPASLRAGRRAARAVFVTLVAIGVAACSSGEGADRSRSRTLTQAGHANSELLHVSACLQEAGWKVTLDPGRGYGAEVPEAQRTAYRTDRDRCEKEFLGDHPRPQLAEADWRKLYRHQVWLVTCLESEGYPPVATPPSEADYVSDGLSGSAPGWFAWEAVGGKPPAELEAKCPQAPPGM